MDNYIRFDWAMKRLLRNKANHAVIEGLLESLLGRKYTIERFLESESNQETEEDKFNRVDILAEGIDEGKKKEKMAIAKNLSSLGIPTSQIMQATGLTEEEINELK